MKKLKILALSDLHLGEPESVLFNSGDRFNLIDITIKKIIELSKGDKEYDSGIEQLILIGDIADLSVASDEEAYENVKIFLTSLLDKVNTDKIIYIPGNHDHHLWVELLKKEYGKDNFRDCFPKIKVDSSILNKEIFIKNCLQSDCPTEKIEIYYPNYRFETDSSFYFFDHGHLFAQALEKFTKARIAKNLENLEDKSYKFMEKVWYKISRHRLIEFFFDWFRKIKLEFSGSSSIKRTTFKEDGKTLLDNYVREKVIWYLEEICGIKSEVEKDFHFIFGHTHHGGRLLKSDRKVRVNGRFISLWNTGGWIVPSEVFSPDACIFYIEQTRDGLRPDMYKLVSQEKPEDEGDYPKEILRERLKHIG